MVASAKSNPFQDPQGPALLPEQLRKLLPAMRLLVVDPDPAAAVILREAIGGIEGKLRTRRAPRRATPATRPTIFAAASLEEAQQAIAKLAARGEAIDLLVVEAEQPDGEGLALAQTLHELHSEARLIITSRNPGLAGGIAAFRMGALDYLPKPLDPATLAQRVGLAAARRYFQVKDQRRLQRLKTAVRQLNQARRTVGKKVDLLCQDLVGAYTDLSRQMERVRVGGHLQKLLESAADLEQLLCHMMDWILRELGHCNIAIFLTDDAGKSELGAYMKHTVPGEANVTRWLARHIIPRVTADGFVHPGGALEARGGGELKAMSKQAFAAVDCTYLAESLGTLIVFRRSEKPFSGDELALLKAAGPVFATALTTLVHAADGDGAPGKQHEQSDDDEAGWWRRSA